MQGGGSGGLPMMLAFLALSTRKYLLRRVLLMSAGTPCTRLSVLGLYTIQSDLLVHRLSVSAVSCRRGQSSDITVKLTDGVLCSH